MHRVVQYSLFVLQKIYLRLLIKGNLFVRAGETPDAIYEEDDATSRRVKSKNPITIIPLHSFSK